MTFEKFLKVLNVFIKHILHVFRCFFRALVMISIDEQLKNSTIDSHLLILSFTVTTDSSKNRQRRRVFLANSALGSAWFHANATVYQVKPSYSGMCSYFFLLENIHAHWLFMRYICPWFSICFLLLGSAAKLLAESTHGSFNLTAYLGEWNYISCELEAIFKKCPKCV